MPHSGTVREHVGADKGLVLFRMIGVKP
jgi:hypothetical protein